MSNLPENHIIDECIDKISNVYISNDCAFEIHPFDCDSREFSITYNGRVPRLTLVHVVVNDGGANRTFIFQVSQDYAYCYADDLMPNKTDHYLYIGEITDCTEKPHILYECDGMACKDCFHKECHETTDITHAKNFKYYNGKWVERRDYSPRNLYC